MRILTEASGSLVSAFLIKAIQDAGHEAIASDINSDCAGRFLADGFLKMPSISDPHLWEKISSLVEEAQINLVIPSFDETLLAWSQGAHLTSTRYQTQVLLSPEDVISTFIDKWKAYEFFVENNIPTPKTSLNQDFPLVKPRFGRGGRGVCIPTATIDMSGCISQQVAEGDEYTVDVLCDNDCHPVYIVPRKRLSVRDGKSTQGIVVKHDGIEKMVKHLCAVTNFRGPINIQCFCDSKQLLVIEVNPRISGGMALAFAATENWVPLMVSMLNNTTRISPKPVKYGLKMMRYYAEVFV